MIATFRMSARSATPAVSATCGGRAADPRSLSQQKTAIVKLVAPAVPFVRRVSTETEVWLGKPAARVAPALLIATKAGPGTPVMERPGAEGSGIEACVATVAHWVMSCPKLTR